MGGFFGSAPHFKDGYYGKHDASKRRRGPRFAAIVA